MRAITKQTFLDAKSCTTLGWHSRAGHTSEPPSEAERFQLEEGRRVGQLARELHPGGVLISEKRTRVAVAKTRAAMADPTVSVIFEAAFAVDDYVARADILRRCGRAWLIAEVKMSLVGGDGLPDLIDDLAYTVTVARRSGVAVTGASLVLLSRDGRRGSRASEAFVEVEHTAAVNERATALGGYWEVVRRETAAETAPAGRLTRECRQCDLFDGHCLGRGVPDHVLHLPNLHASKIARLGDAGIVAVAAIPDEFPMTEAQRRAVACIRTRQPYVASDLARELGHMEWPVRYLDFESVMTALPLYDGVAPYEQVLTQYSVHTCSAPGVIADHAEYLADHQRDCRRDLADRLLHDLGEAGSIVVYSPFERTRIAGLASRFPDLADRLMDAARRLFDLLPIVRRHYYHHALRGSHSLKRLLPAVVPASDYRALAIADGGTAVARFARMALGQYDSETVRQTRTDLLAYCQQDTHALVQLHAALLRLRKRETEVS